MNNNYIHEEQYGVIMHFCPDFNGIFVKPLFEFGISE